MHYAIIEDEPYSCELLQYSMSRLRPDYKLAFTSATIAGAVKLLQGVQDLDLIFMDIELADGNSFEIFKETRVDAPVIFTTSYNEYAIQAFKVHSIDYLLKPFSEADLEQALDKFERLCPKGNPAVTEQMLQQMTAPTQRSSRLRIESGDKYKFVNLEDVAWFVSEDKYVFAVLADGHRALTGIVSLQDAEDMLPEADFFRVSRNMVVSINAIKSVSKYFRRRLLLKIAAGGTEEELTISSSRRDDFLNWLGR